MGKNILSEIIKNMPDHLAIKVRRVAKDRKISFEDAVIFLVQKGINTSSGSAA